MVGKIWKEGGGSRVEGKEEWVKRKWDESWGDHGG